MVKARDSEDSGADWKIPTSRRRREKWGTRSRPVDCGWSFRLTYPHRAFGTVRDDKTTVELKAVSERGLAAVT
jgi:hypothetical protein